MRIQTGNSVSGDDFYKRDYLIDKAWDLIESGNHILIAAPRRVGKTSLMYYLNDNPKENYTFLYLDTESINKENEFFRRIVNKVLKTDFIKGSQKILTFLETHKPTIKKVGPDGVEFGVSEEHDYLDMLLQSLHFLEQDQSSQPSVLLELKDVQISIPGFPCTQQHARFSQERYL